MRCCDAVDIHTHVVPADFPANPGGVAAWPSMAEAPKCHRSVMIDGTLFRTVGPETWSGSRRLDDMDAMGVGLQVLSPMPELLSYWMDAAPAAALCRHLNEQIAATVAESPKRFVGLAAVPLQDVSRAIDALHEAVGRLGLAGVEIGTHVNEVPLGDASFLPFFEAAEALGAAIFIHPLRPCGMSRLVGPAALEQVLAFPGETGLAAASLLTGGTLARCPRLRIALSHGGGSFAALVARLQHAWEVLPALREQMRDAPLALARRLYFDSLVYHPSLLREQIEMFGLSQTLIGTDYPFVIRDTHPVSRLQLLGLGQGADRLLIRDNALRWLGRQDGATTIQSEVFP